MNTDSGRILYIRPKPEILFSRFPNGWADRVEVNTDDLGPQRGVWLKVTEHLCMMLVDKIGSDSTPADQREKIQSMIDGIHERAPDVLNAAYASGDR